VTTFYSSSLLLNDIVCCLHQKKPLISKGAKIDCLSFVMCPPLAQLIIGFFFAAAVYSTNEANKAGLKQSIFVDVYGRN
jgi:hypothetical protein